MNGALSLLLVVSIQSANVTSGDASSCQNRQPYCDDTTHRLYNTKLCEDIRDECGVQIVCWGKASAGIRFHSAAVRVDDDATCNLSKFQWCKGECLPASGRVKEETYCRGAILYKKCMLRALNGCAPEIRTPKLRDMAFNLNFFNIRRENKCGIETSSTDINDDDDNTCDWVAIQWCEHVYVGPMDKLFRQHMTGDTNTKKTIRAKMCAKGRTLKKCILPSIKACKKVNTMESVKLLAYLDYPLMNCGIGIRDMLLASACAAEDEVLSICDYWKKKKMCNPFHGSEFKLCKGTCQYHCKAGNPDCKDTLKESFCGYKTRENSEICATHPDTMFENCFKTCRVCR